MPDNKADNKPDPTENKSPDTGSVSPQQKSFKDYLWTDRFFWIAAVIVILPQLSFTTTWLLWPLRQFSTYVHELFHGLLSLLTGGSFDRMVMLPDGGGTAYVGYFTNFGSALTSAGGLLGPAIVGAIMLFFSRRFRVTHYLFLVLAIVIGASGFLWARDWYTFIFCMITTLILGAAYFVPSKTFVRIFAQVIAIQLCLQNLLDFRYMFIEKFERDGQVLFSDTGNIAQAMGGSFLIWAMLIAGLTMVIVFFALWKSTPD